MGPSEDAISVVAPAKVNLTLHITGQRADGYHELDSLVVFAPDASDHVYVEPADAMSLHVSGPFAHGVPEDARNLCWQAAALYGRPVALHLDKHLPHAAGIGGGSSDAAAVLRGMEALFDAPFEGDAAKLGADVPVCRTPKAQWMAGIGENLRPAQIPALHAVLVNPRIEVPTGSVFAALTRKTNPGMTPLVGDLRPWLLSQRNDLEIPALRVAPQIGEVLDALVASKAWLSRMSGSGATCFGLYDSRSQANDAAERLRNARPDWWVVASDLV